MDNKSLTYAFATLVGLSIITTLLAERVTGAGYLFVAGVLVLSGLKGRVILTQYLGLAQAPSFRRGFTAFLVGFVALAFAIYAIGG
jgi:hypothetical protein